MGPRTRKAGIVVCLGLNPDSADQTMQNLKVCSGILDYFRAIQGQGYIMTVNFSATKLMQANTSGEAEACIRWDCTDWQAVLDRAVERLKFDAPESCDHYEILLVGTDDVPGRVTDSAALQLRLRQAGIRVNAVVVEAGDDGRPGRTGPADGWNPKSGWKIVDPEGEPAEFEQGWEMATFARDTGGLTLFPNSEGKLAIHQLFGEMFRRWGELYWESVSLQRTISRALTS